MDRFITPRIAIKRIVPGSQPNYQKSTDKKLSEIETTSYLKFFEVYQISYNKNIMKDLNEPRALKGPGGWKAQVLKANRWARGHFNNVRILICTIPRYWIVRNQVAAAIIHIESYITILYLIEQKLANPNLTLE